MNTKIVLSDKGIMYLFLNTIETNYETYITLNVTNMFRCAATSYTRPFTSYIWHCGTNKLALEHCIVDNILFGFFRPVLVYRTTIVPLKYHIDYGFNMTELTVGHILVIFTERFT